MPGRASCATSSITDIAPAIWSKSCRAWKSTVPNRSASGSQASSLDLKGARLEAVPLEIVPPKIVATRNLPTAWREQVENIFFEASGRTFVPGAARDWFHYRWLGRYLDAPGDPVLLAIAGETVAGYLVG